jgi:alkanesulfonate monooxygenase SsuD/methylene tetrahydromethanopterin reductase-like flavin-dependent oxidoreductase (luciferase family)
LLHGSAETVIARLREMQARTGMTSLLLHYPPYYGREKAMKSLKLFAERVMPAFRPPARRSVAAE